MKWITTEEAIQRIQTFTNAERIQIFCVAANDTACPLCKGVTESPNLFEQLEADGLTDVFLLRMDDVFKVFPPPNKFLMFMYIPWNQRQSPQTRDHFLPYDDMKKELSYWAAKRRI